MDAANDRESAMTVGISDGQLGKTHRVTTGSTTQSLLRCGVLSSALYAATDLIGGLRYGGYSFASQAISELGAIGAPSKPIVDPLFAVYNLLALMFGFGVYQVALAGRNRALRFSAIALIGYGSIGIVAGIVGPFFSMQQRGAGSLTTDAPHIVLTGVLVLLLLLAIGFSAFALGTRFRLYSFATLATTVVFGALTMPFAPRLAAGQPTPGLGIVERIDVYSALLWLAVLAIALIKRPDLTGQRRLP